MNYELKVSTVAVYLANQLANSQESLVYSTLAGVYTLIWANNNGILFHFAVNNSLFAVNNSRFFVVNGFKRLFAELFSIFFLDVGCELVGWSNFFSIPFIRTSRPL